MDNDRAKGMLWGLVVGDCLGSPIQFSEKDDHPWITEMEECPVFGLPAGYWTDDSSMAFCIMDSFVRLGKYDLEDVANTFLRWYRDGYWSSVEGRSFDVGGATACAMHGVACGKFKNGEEDSQGNGSIMRFAPSYLVSECGFKRSRMKEISDITHDSKKVRQTVDQFAHMIGQHLSGIRTTAQGMYATRDEAGSTGWCVSTLYSALWAFQTTNTFEDGMVAAVNLGGDSDSIGAVYGQLAGAYYGFSAIPGRWVRSVKDWQKVDALIEKFLSKVIETKEK